MIPNPLSPMPPMFGFLIWFQDIELHFVRQGHANDVIFFVLAFNGSSNHPNLLPCLMGFF